MKHHVALTVTKVYHRDVDRSFTKNGVFKIFFKNYYFFIFPPAFVKITRYILPASYQVRKCDELLPPI